MERDRALDMPLFELGLVVAQRRCRDPCSRRGVLRQGMCIALPAEQRIRGPVRNPGKEGPLSTGRTPPPGLWPISASPPSTRTPAGSGTVEAARLPADRVRLSFLPSTRISSFPAFLSCERIGDEIPMVLRHLQRVASAQETGRVRDRTCGDGWRSARHSK